MYTLLTGRFSLRYPDLPRGGPEWDGDTVKFRPDTPAFVETLPRISGEPPKLNARGISVRLEAIDALETHFEGTHQELPGAVAARDRLVSFVGFTGVQYFQDLPNKVESADQDDLPGYVLSNGIDGNGRMIGFVHTGTPPAADGSPVFVDDALVDTSANKALLEEGLVYPAFYGTLPASLRRHLGELSVAARAAGSGLWARSTADPDGPATAGSVADLEELVIWPKLFRRLVAYFATGATDLSTFDSWLRSDQVNRDDALYLIADAEPGNLHDVLEVTATQIRLTLWPEDFIISPDPAAPGTQTTPAPSTSSDVLIVAAVPDPAGYDRGSETVSLLNTTADDVDLSGWTLRNQAGRDEHLTGACAAGDVTRIQLSTLTLANTGGALTLLDPSGARVDQVSYTRREVRPGRTLVFTRSR